MSDPNYNEKNHKLREYCPHCGASVFIHPETKYCMGCGKKLDINTCKNKSCIICEQQIILPDSARYCPVCGKTTTYEDELPF